jgi:hypothetical protein
LIVRHCDADRATIALEIAPDPSSDVRSRAVQWKTGERVCLQIVDEHVGVGDHHRHDSRIPRHAAIASKRARCSGVISTVAAWWHRRS